MTVKSTKAVKATPAATPDLAAMIAAAVAQAMAGMTKAAPATKASVAAKAAPAAKKVEVQFLEMEMGAELPATLADGRKVMICRGGRSGKTFVKLA